MPISRVYMICNAYESGYGHGHNMDGLVNPYKKDSELYEAYNIGVAAGTEAKFEDKNKEEGNG